jgi:hypothetical protein
VSDKGRRDIDRIPEKLKHNGGKVHVEMVNYLKVLAKHPTPVWEYRCQNLREIAEELERLAFVAGQE